MFDSCKTSTNSNYYTSSNHLTIGKNIETKTKYTHCIRRLRFKQLFEQQQTFINIRRHQKNHFCKLNKRLEEEKEVDDKSQIATHNNNRRNLLSSESVTRDPISRSMDTATSSGETETAKTTTITTNMMSTGRRKRELSLFIPQALNIGQIIVRDNNNNSNNNKSRRKRTTAKMTTKRLMTTKSVISVLVLTFMLHLFMQTSIGAQAIKLPSFLSWIQPASQSQAASKSQYQQQQSLNSATIPTQQLSLIHKHHHLFGTQNVASSSGAANSAATIQQKQQDNEPMLASASSLQPEAKTQQPASGLRRPFQSMLLLAPSKHNHLFSALPKTLFGRLLSSSSSSAPSISASSTTLSSTTPSPATGVISTLAMPTIAWTGSQKSAYQQPYPNPTLTKFAQEQQQQQQAIAFNLNHYRQQLQQYQMQQQQQLKQPQQQNLRQLSINLPKKHALGLGESDEFMIVDASSGQHLGLEQILNQDQLVQKPTSEHQHNYNSRQQQQQQQPPRKDYQEMPAIVITDQEALEQQSRPVSSSSLSASNTSQATESSGAILQAQDSSNSAQISLEASKLNNNSSELQIDSSSNSMNATQATVLNGAESGENKENATKSNSGESLAPVVAEVEAESVDSALSQQSAVTSSSPMNNQTVAENDKSRQLVGENNNNNNYNMSGTSVLTTLISDELSKLKQEPEVLNKTLSSMSQPLVALFLQDAGSQPVMRSNSNENSSSNRNIDIQKNTDQTGQQTSSQSQTATLENSSSENGDLESSAAAIIVSSPADAGDSGNSIENSRALGDQLSSLSDEQIESFIIGPYKGLTSDSSSQAQQILPTEHHYQFRDLPSSEPNSPAQFLANFQAQQMRPQQQQQQQQQQHNQAHFSNVRPQQSHVGLGMSSMASNLIQQAKSLIHFPFAHLASSQMATNHIPAVFRGQQQQQQISMSVSPQLIGGERFLLNRPDMMIDQSSSPPSSFHIQQALSSNKQLYNGSPMNKQPLPAVQMMRQVQGNNRYRQQQQQQQRHHHRRPFYRQQQQQGVGRPPSFAKNAPSTYPSLSSSNNQYPMFGQNSATNLKPIHETTQFGIQHNNGPIQQSRYFVRPAAAAAAGSKQQSELSSNVQSVEEKQASSSSSSSSKPRMPYFGENPTQQHSMNRELVQLGAPNKFDNSYDNSSSSNVVNNDDDNNLQQYSTLEGRQKVGKSHPLNDLAASRQAAQQSDFHFVVNHGGQVGFQPTPSVLFEQQQQPINDAKPQQQQQVNVQSKFKSGLYQIDPPKLADGTGSNTDEQQQQEHVAIPDGESDSPAEEDAEQQRQYLSAEQQTDQQRHLLAGSEPQSSQEEAEDDDSQEAAQQQADTRENENSSGGGQDFARQVGATIGVGLNNKTKKGQVFNEPIAPAGGNQRSKGKNLTQMKKLKHTQDITLYDFEVPQRQQQQQQASNNQLQKQIAQPVSYLDTQVYTIPYTINLPQQTQQPGNSRQVYGGNTPSVSASYQTTSFQQPAPRHHRPHQQQPAFNPYSQIGRFPLFYLPPPPPSQPHPQALHEMVAPTSQQQQQQQQQQPQYQTNQYQHQIQHNNANMSPNIVHEQVIHHTSQTAPRPLHSDFGVSQFNNQWPTSQHLFNPVPALAVQSVGSYQVDQQGAIRQNGSTSSDEQQLAQLTNSFEPAGALQVSGLGNKQHYFHYQPVASLNQQANQEQQLVVTTPLQENGARQLTSTEQAPVYEFPVSATQGPIEQQQQQQPQQQQQAQLSQATESSQLNDFTSPNVNRDPSNTDNQENSSRATTIVTANDESLVVRENGEVPSSSSQRQNERRAQIIATSEIEPEREQQQQFQLIGQSSNQISSPSAFCADRAPGLYADVSQRCRSYYQCAPTGHQMFHCNNQTQFNQKTQNCDWWYNVNCGGRLGSQADFEQAPVSTTTTTTTTPSSQTTSAESNTVQSGELLSRQPDRDAVASSIVVNQESSSADNGVGQQVAPLSVLILTDDQSVRESEEQQKQQQQQLQQSESQNRATGRHNSRWNQQQQRQQQQRDEAEMFHHSDSMANITVAPDVNDNQQRQQQQQQLAAPSSTPSYNELQASAIKEIEAFAQRSSTTQDPLLGAQEQQFNSDTSSQQQQQQSVDSQPQVGSIPEGASSSSGAVKSANQNEGQSSSLSSSPNQSSQFSVTSDPTISADATTSIQTNSASSEPQTTTTTTTSSSVAATPTVATPTLTTTTTATSQQQQLDEQLETTNQENNQPTNNKGRRLVQSEFGAGAKQGIATKAARSTSRFQFTRNSAISNNDNLFSGKVLSESGETRPDEQQYQQHANHRYKLETNDRNGAQIYSTSANQGSVNYMPADEHNNYLAVAAAAAAKAAGSQQQEQAEQQVEGVTGTEKRAEKRFGERLINVEKTTSSNNAEAKKIESANRTQKR